MLRKLYQKLCDEILSISTALMIRISSRKAVAFVYATSANLVYKEKIWRLFDGQKQRIFLTRTPGEKFVKPKHIWICRLETMISGNSGLEKRFFRNIPVRIHVPHSTTSLTHIYPMGAFDAFNHIFAIGRFHSAEVNKWFPHMDVHEVGYMMLYGELNKLYASSNEKILLAFSWYEGNILEEAPTQLFDKLIELGFEIHIRPHPGHLVHNKEVIDEILQTYPKDVFLDLSPRADFGDFYYLFTDWSGVALEFAFATERPVFFVDSKQKINNLSVDQSYVPMEAKIRGSIGPIVSPDDCDNFRTLLKETEERSEFIVDEIRRLKYEEFYCYGHEAAEACEKLKKLSGVTHDKA